MTTANLLNVVSVKGPQADVSKKLQDENREVTEIFASMMSQTVNTANRATEDTASKMGVSKGESTQTITNSYERYSYKNNQIETAKNQGVSEENTKLSEETLKQTEEKILSALREEYGVDEETLQNLLEDMGLNVLDLLDSKNLTSFIMELTGISSGEELLLDESFLKVMEILDEVSNNLMKEWKVDADGLQEILSQVETISLDNKEEILEQDALAQSTNLNAQTAETAAATTQQDAQNVQEASDEAVETVNVQVEKQEDTTDTEGSEEVKETENKVSGLTVEEEAEHKDTGKDASLSNGRNTGQESLLNQENGSNQVFATGQSTVPIGQTVEMPQMQFSSYFTVDTAQILEQLAEQIKVVVTPDTTSMEMQLNPENLGKIYLNVSAEEGVVNAHFIATNEAVKEALEAQITILRENLTQAGVKVDAIEVTVASHEFERNLEQDQKNPEEQVQQEKAPRRHNLTVDSLDELQGIMTEEEALTAQIMRDNGNSVDFTA